MKHLCIAALLLLGTSAAWAIDVGPAFDDPKLQARYQALIAEIRCVTCQNQTIKDSNAFLAADLRREVREQMEAGATNQQIYDFLTARYGEFVLYKTPFNAKTWVIWAFPPVLLALAAFVVFRTIRKRSVLPVDEDAL